MSTFPQESFPMSWGPMLNLSTGKAILDDETITLQPNVAGTVITGGMGKGAYTPKVFNIADICGYSSGFAAWMSIHFTDGSKMKVSVAISKKAKRQFIEAIERRRAYCFTSRKLPVPPLQSQI